MRSGIDGSTISGKYVKNQMRCSNSTCENRKSDFKTSKEFVSEAFSSLQFTWEHMDITSNFIQLKLIF